MPRDARRYFANWRSAALSEAQAKFQFTPGSDTAAVRRTLSERVKLAVLDGVDPAPTNLCAAGSMALKSGVVPPSTGAVICLLRLEVNPNFGPAGAARLTVRASHQGLADTLVRAVAALFGGV